MLSAGRVSPGSDARLHPQSTRQHARYNTTSIFWYVCACLAWRQICAIPHDVYLDIARIIQRVKGQLDLPILYTMLMVLKLNVLFALQSARGSSSCNWVGIFLHVNSCIIQNRIDWHFPMDQPFDNKRYIRSNCLYVSRNFSLIYFVFYVQTVNALYSTDM